MALSKFLQKHLDLLRLWFVWYIGKLYLSGSGWYPPGSVTVNAKRSVVIYLQDIEECQARPYLQKE
jgi:hypothetical protein